MRIMQWDNASSADNADNEDSEDSADNEDNHAVLNRELKIKNWTSCIQDRNNGKLYVEKAKTFNDWNCSAQRRRKKCWLGK